MNFVDSFNKPERLIRNGDNTSVKFRYGTVNHKEGRKPLIVPNMFLGGLSGILSAVDYFTKEDVLSGETADTFIEGAERMSLFVARVFTEPLMVMAGQVIAEADDPLINQAFRERGFEGKVVLHDRPLRIGSAVCIEVERRANELGISNPKARLLLVTAGRLIEHVAITPHGARFSWNAIKDRDGTLVDSLTLTPRAHMTQSRYDARPSLGEVLRQFDHYSTDIAPIMNPTALAHQIVIDYIVEPHL